MWRARPTSAHRRRSPRRHQEGAAALEFALVLPLFVVLILGLIDFGTMLYTVNTITNAAREGARQGVVQRQQANIEAAAQDAAQNYLDAAGISDTTVTASFDGTSILTVTVAIQNYANITGFSYGGMDLFHDPSSTATMRWEFAN